MKQIGICAGALVTGILSLAAGCSKSSPKPPNPVAPVEPSRGAVGQPPSGRPAISPPPNAQITETQVRSYVLSHRVPRALQATNMAIVSISFINSQQVRSLLHSPNLGIPDQEPMCLVILSGTFVFPGPPGTTPTFPIAIEVYDARTGNLLQSGGLPRPPQPR
jgi:hypothetical protein